MQLAARSERELAIFINYVSMQSIESCGHGQSFQVGRTYFWTRSSLLRFLSERASEQGNVIGLVSVYTYIYMSSKKIVIEQTRDLIYLKFVVTDFSPKIISPSAGENSGDSV